MSQEQPKRQTTGVYQMIAAAWQSLSAGMPDDRHLDREIVNSMSVVSVGYKRTSKTLQVEYFSGWVCEASGVPSELYKQLMQARDFDAVFRRQIHARYPMDRVGRLLPVFGG
jgi:hypothetical protein